MTRLASAIWLTAIAVVVGSTTTLVGVHLFRGNTDALLQPGNSEIVARGQAVYLERCASCHGRNLEGQPDWQTADKDGFLPAPPHDQSGHTWHHPDKLLFDITKLGVVAAANLKDYKTRMPIFGGVLSDGDIIAALSYIKSQWPEDVRRRHDQLNRVYAQRQSGTQPK